MIVEYHRPKTTKEAIHLLERSNPPTWPLAGGTVINQPSKSEYAVVDLQLLGLDQIEKKGNYLQIGAMTTLQNLLGIEEIQNSLKTCILLDATYNLRQVGTVAGTLVSTDGRSPFSTAMLALDAKLNVLPGNNQIELGEFLLSRRDNRRGKLITHISIPLNIKLAYHAVSRTPADLPIVCAAAALWPSGRVRIALGGYGAAPIMALDGPDTGGVESAVMNAYANADDEWATAEYRRTMAVTLSNRCVGDVLVQQSAE